MKRRKGFYWRVLLDMLLKCQRFLLSISNLTFIAQTCIPFSSESSLKAAHKLSEANLWCSGIKPYRSFPKREWDVNHQRSNATLIPRLDDLSSDPPISDRQSRPFDNPSFWKLRDPKSAWALRLSTAQRHFCSDNKEGSCVFDLEVCLECCGEVHLKSWRFEQREGCKGNLFRGGRDDGKSVWELCSWNPYRKPAPRRRSWIPDKSNEKIGPFSKKQEASKEMVAFHQEKDPQKKQKTAKIVKTLKKEAKMN